MSKIIRPRLACPAGMVVDRCQAKSVRRSAAVSRIVRDVGGPRAIPIPLQRGTLLLVSAAWPSNLINKVCAWEYFMVFTVGCSASITASATPVAYRKGKSTSAPEERGIRGLRRHAEWPKVTHLVI